MWGRGWRREDNPPHLESSSLAVKGQAVRLTSERCHWAPGRITAQETMPFQYFPILQMRKQRP